MDSPLSADTFDSSILSLRLYRTRGLMVISESNGSTLKLNIADLSGTTQKAAAAPAATSTSNVDKVTLSGTTQKSGPTVSYVDKIKKSGDINIDALLAGGNAWWHTSGASGIVPSAVAQHNVTYSFISDASGLNAQDANGFQALTSSQQDTVKQALDYISSVVGVTFTEVSSGGDIQYGSNTQSNSSGYSRYPNQGSQVFLANNQSTFSGSWTPGSYEWETVLHETGHALGLKHPGNYNAGGGGTPGPYLPASQDNRGNTIMSYHQPPNTTLIRQSNGMFSRTDINPDTYQKDDIAALQYLYGSPQSSDATTYSWSVGQAISETIWNNNSASAIDLSNQTLDNVVDLRAGKKSSIAVRNAYADMSITAAQYAKLTSGGKKLTSLLGVPTYTGKNNLTLAAGSHIDNAVGGSGDDRFITNKDGDNIDGGDGNDKFFVTGGDDTIAGGNGDDTLYILKKAGAKWTLSGDHSTLTETSTNTKTHVTTTLETLSLSGIEHVAYWDGTTLAKVGKSLLA